jgi:O-antigen biosynthesis protein
VEDGTGRGAVAGEVYSPSEVPERFDPETMQGETIEAEHLARYRWASQLVPGRRRVLDAGCGMAYGTALLAASGAGETVGVDLAEEVLDHVREQMPNGVVLLQGDVRRLPFDDDTFDLVVCFEVIEHVSEPGEVLDELRRVLAPGGVLVISSPNRDTYPQGNPHHVHEFTPPELESELSSRFAQVRMIHQHTWITSGVVTSDVFLRGGDEDAGQAVHLRKLAQDGLGDELYTLGLAGDTQLPDVASVFEIAAPVEVRRWDELWREQNERLIAQAELLSDHELYHAQVADELHALRVALESAERDLSKLAELEQRAEELEKVNDELIGAEGDLARREEVLDELEATAQRYTVVVTSSSWRITKPLRDLMAKIRGPLG